MPLLSSLPVLSNFKIWIDGQGLFYIWDISRWDSAPPHHWVIQSLHDCQEEIEDKNRLFLSHLTGLAQLERGVKDKHD